MGEPSTWAVKRFADVGTHEPFVARISIGLTDVLGATLYDNKQEITEAMLIVSHDGLMPAFQSLRDLRKIVSQSDVPELDKIKNFDDMYKYLWIAYKDRMQSAARRMGYEIGFLFQKDSKFQQACEDFQKANPSVSPELIRLMKSCRANWQQELMRFRNDYLE